MAVMTANVIFVTSDDASPLITFRHGITAADILGVLSGFQRDDTEYAPGQTAVRFLRAMSPDQYDEFGPQVESIPVDCESTAFEGLYGDDLIVWNIQSWKQVFEDAPA